MSLMSSASAAILLLRSSSLRSRSVLVRTTTASILSQQQPQPQYAAFSTTTNANSNNNNSKPASLRRDDLVKTVAETHELSQAESRRIIDTIVDTISDALSENKKVALSSFGSFSTYTSKQRHAKNPRTGADILVPPKERVRFKAFASLKKVVAQPPKS